MLKKASLLYGAILLPFVMIFFILYKIVFYGPEPIHAMPFLYGLINNKESISCEEQIKSALLPTASMEQVQHLSSICPSFKLYIYHVDHAASTPIHLADAKQLTKQHQLTTTLPNDFIIDPYCNVSSGIGWWTLNINSQHPICLVKNQRRQILNISTWKDDYFFIFLGWVLKEKS